MHENETSQSGQSYAQLRRRLQLTLTGHAMQSVAADLPPMGPGLSPELIKKAKSLDIASNRRGCSFFTLKGHAGEVLADVHLPQPQVMGLSA